MRSVPKLTFAKYLVVAAAVIMAVVVFSLPGSKMTEVSASASGPSPSYTGAPLENNCTACHSSFPVNSGTGSVQISGLPANYLPNQVIPLTVTTADENAVIYGFQMVALNSAGQSVGTLNVPPATPQQLQVISGFVNGNQRRYIEHTSFGTIPTVFGSKTWNFSWTAPAQRIGKLNFYAAGNGANSDSSTSGDRIYTTSGTVLSGSAIANFDGDTKSDASVYRPSTGTWYAHTSAGPGYLVTQFGEPGDIPAPGDYDGDGNTDFAVFRPSNATWYIRTNTTYTQTQFGEAGDIPVPGDYDGDGKYDIAVWRPFNGTWYFLGSTGIYRVRQFGQMGDKPAQGDYDGDAITDFSIYRPSNGTWYLVSSLNPAFSAIQLGTAEEVPVPGDYDGNGTTDFFLYRPSDGVWHGVGGGGIPVNPQPGDKPAPADYDGDGKTDACIFRHGTFYIQGSTGIYYYIAFGQDGDLPVASSYFSNNTP